MGMFHVGVEQQLSLLLAIIPAPLPILRYIGVSEQRAEVYEEMFDLYYAPVPKRERNEAFIDSQNLHLGIRHLGWTLDAEKFRRYLSEQYGVVKAYMFIGFREEFTELYSDLQSAGFILVLKPTIKARDGTVKGNCDADLVLQAMIDFPTYDKAVIVTGDGDFASLVRYLREQGKLKCLLVPDKDRYSGLLVTAAEDAIAFLSGERQRLAAAKKAAKKLPDAPVLEVEHVDAPLPMVDVQPVIEKKARPKRRGRRGGRRGRGRRGQGRSGVVL